MNIGAKYSTEYKHRCTKDERNTYGMVAMDNSNTSINDYPCNYSRFGNINHEWA